MADQYIDLQGKPVILPQSSEPTQPPAPVAAQQSQYIDLNGKPVGADKDGKLLPNPDALASRGQSMPNLRGTPVGGLQGAAPIVGRMGAAALPAVLGTVGAGLGAGADLGSGGLAALAFNPVTGASAGGALGSSIKGILQSKFPKLFGEDENADDPAGAALNIGKDAAIQGLTEFGLQGAQLGTKAITAKIAASKYGQMFPAVQNAVRGNLEKQLNTFRTSDVDTLDSAAENALNTNPSDPSEIGKKLINLKPELGDKPLRNLPIEQDYGDVAKKALSDVTQVRNFKAAGGSPDAIEKLALNKALSKGISHDGSVDPDKILSEFHGDNSDVYREAISSDTRSTVGQLLNQMKQAKANPTVDRLLNMSPAGKLFFASAGGWAGHRLAGEPGMVLGEAATGGVLGGAMLSQAVFKKLMSNPESAQLVLQAMKTPTSAPEADLIQKALAGAVRGSVALTQTADK